MFYNCYLKLKFFDFDGPYAFIGWVSEYIDLLSWLREADLFDSFDCWAECYESKCLPSPADMLNSVGLGIPLII